ncbi:KTSC domain-containing protein [Lysobacteraceae bacterium NML93-0399]|nr:KTSC domain-containing protein [Xanthomonadaceae bacterium NML93-0399]
MEMHSVESSNLIAVGYDEERMVLRVEFKGGVTYDYFDVPLREYQGLMGAGSHGEYMNVHIRTSYRYQRL